MTSKELLYIEDALGHEQFFQTKCAQTAGEIQDPELKSFVENIASQHRQIFSDFYGLLG